MPERDQPVDVLVVALVIERPVDGDAAELEHVQARQPRGRQRRQDSLRGDAQGLVQFGRSFRGIERNRHDRTRRQLGGEIGFRLRQRRPAIEAAAQHRAEGIALQPLRSRGQFDLVRVGEVECQLRRRGVAPHRLDLQAAQYDLLQPGWIIGAEFARRHRVAPQPPPHPAHGLALAERAHAGREEIQQHAQ